MTPSSFRPFGRVIEQPARPVDASGPGWRWWAETVLLPSDGRPFGVGYLDLEPAEPRFDWAERHMRTVEVVIPTNGECLVYVAPPEHLDEPERLPAFDRFQVFRVPPGMGVAMDKGVWHGAPLATRETTKALVLILEHTGRDDVTLVRFPQSAVEIEV